MKITERVLKKIIKEEIMRSMQSHEEEDIFHDEPPGLAKQFIDPEDLYAHFDLDGDGKVSIEDYINSLESYMKKPEVLDALKMRRYDEKGVYNKSNVIDTGRYLRSTQYHKPAKDINYSHPAGIPSGGKTFDIG